MQSVYHQAIHTHTHACTRTHARAHIHTLTCVSVMVTEGVPIKNNLSPCIIEPDKSLGASREIAGGYTGLCTTGVCTICKRSTCVPAFA